MYTYLRTYGTLIHVCIDVDLISSVRRLDVASPVSASVANLQPEDCRLFSSG